MKNLPLSYIEISKSNLIHNIKEFRSVLNKKTKISAVIKANAYGHGDKEVVKVLNSFVDYFQVNSVEELERVKKLTKKEILVLGYVGKHSIAKAIKLGGTLAIFDLEHAMLVNQQAKRQNKKQKIHVVIDAHLGREGVLPSKVESFVDELLKMKNLKVEGVYAHFANIEDTTDFSHAKKQIDAYEKALEIFKQKGFKNIKRHISATSGTLVYEKNNGINDIARIGIGLYGLWPSEEIRRAWEGKIELKPVLRWITHIAQVKELPKGETVGYGLTFRAKKDMKIAVIPQGYSDGYDRRLSNKGKVLINGRYAPVLGRVMMNMFVVDVTNILDVTTEEEVILLGGNLTAEKLAEDIGTINYEIPTKISLLLPRTVK